MDSPLILTVSQLNAYTRSLIDGDENLANIFLVGEISNFVNHYRSGHLYMTIKDSTASIKAVMFAGNANRLKFMPQNGMSVIIRGRVSIYERDGQYQLYIDDMQPDGIGSLSIAFEQLKEKLKNAGLFNQEHKKSIPKYPSAIGVISSPTGAAVQDVLNVLGRRFPAAEIIFAGVQVQGGTASQQVCTAIEQFNALSCVDVIIIARGGGSAEDLWPFNNENLAYAIYNSNIPIVSGVGHETDFTICDFVSDLRAPTPSAAAELVVPNIEEQRRYMADLHNTLNVLIERKLHDEEYRLDMLINNTVLKEPFSVIDSCDTHLTALWDKINISLNEIYSQCSAKFSLICSSLEALSPLKVLSRGYSIVRGADGDIKASADTLTVGDKIEIDFSKGKASGIITEVNL